MVPVFDLFIDFDPCYGARFRENSTRSRSAIELHAFAPLEALAYV
jgi:hypothetical protein